MKVRKAEKTFEAEYNAETGEWFERVGGIDEKVHQ